MNNKLEEVIKSTNSALEKGKKREKLKKTLKSECQKLAVAVVIAQFILAIGLYMAIKYDLDRFVRPQTVVILGK